MGNSEYERDFNDQSALKRPGRLDFRTLNNITDAGDGFPGLQKCLRNLLYAGYLEQDIDLVGHGIKGTSVDINNAELQQLSNIGATEISGAQWGYVGEADQPVKIADSPTFGGLTVNGNILITGTVDGVDISTFKTDYDTHKASTGADHTYIDQSVIITASPTFNGLTVNGNILITGTVDGVDISDFKTDYDTKINQNLKTNDSPTFVGLTLSANLVTISTIDGVDVSVFKTDTEAFLGIGSGNAQYIGCPYEHDSTYGAIFQQVNNMFTNAGGITTTYLYFDIPLPCNRGSYSLKLDDLYIWITDGAWNNDYINSLRIYGVQSDWTEDLLYENLNNEEDGTVTYDLGNINCSGYRKLVVKIETYTLNTGALDFYAPIVKYFYS